MEPYGDINIPPDAPTIEGEENGDAGTEYKYGFTSIDPANDDIAEYNVNWGDDSPSEIIAGPFASGEKALASHTWTDEGTYVITAKAKDVNDLKSDWSSHKIIIGPKLIIQSIKGGLFKITVDIENLGAVEATGVNWRITLDGGAFIGKVTEGSDLTIAADGIETINSNFIIGFGPTVVNVETWIPDGSTDMKELNGFVFLILINIKPSGGI